MIFLIIRSVGSHPLMKENQKLQGKFAIIFGAVLILVAFGLLFLPTLTMQLYSWYHLANYQSHQAEIAAQLKPQLEETTEPSVHFAYQHAKLEAGEKDELIRVYEDLHNRYPEEASLNFYLARITNDNSWITALPGDHHSITAAIAYRADNQLSKGRYHHVLKHASRLPESWLKSYLMAKALAKLDRMDQAQQIFEQALSYPDAPKWIRIQYAETLYRQNSVIRQNLFEDWSNEDLMHYPQAYAYQEVISDKEILDVFNQAPEPIICLPEPLNILAWEALAQEDLVAARILLNRSGQMKPSQPEVTALFSILANKEERTDYAKQLKHTGLDSNAYPTEFHTRMADVLNSWGETEAAVKHYQKAWRRLPEMPELLYKHGRHLYFDDQPCEAIGQFQQALDLQPDNKDLQTWIEKATKSCK